MAKLDVIKRLHKTRKTLHWNLWALSPKEPVMIRSYEQNSCHCEDCRTSHAKCLLACLQKTVDNERHHNARATRC